MRITIHIPDELEQEIKTVAHYEKRSVSSLIAEATRDYLQIVNRRMHGNKILEIVKTAKVSPDALQVLHHERNSDDRA